MSDAKMRRDVARLMIEECEYVVSEMAKSTGVGGEVLQLLIARKVFWEKVEERAALEYNMEGVD